MTVRFYMFCVRHGPVWVLPQQVATLKPNRKPSPMVSKSSSSHHLSWFGMFRTSFPHDFFPYFPMIFAYFPPESRLCPISKAMTQVLGLQERSIGEQKRAMAMAMVYMDMGCTLLTIESQ